MTANTDKIIAHRGESYIAPENTLAAINMAWQKGAKAVEIDIHLTADNYIVTIHDNHTGRTGNKKYIIANSTLEELKTIDVGEAKDMAFKGEEIPTLIDVIKTIPYYGKLIIEIKCSERVLNPLVSVLQNSGLQNSQFEIISFNYQVLSQAKKLMPQYKMLWLLDLDYYWPHWLLRVNYKKIMRKLKKYNLEGINVWAGKLLNKKFISKFKEHGFLVYTWTVNDIDKARELLESDIDAITTDRANWLTHKIVE